MIKFEDVNKIYPNGTQALKNINLEVDSVEVVNQLYLEQLIECMKYQAER